MSITCLLYVCVRQIISHESDVCFDVAFVVVVVVVCVRACGDWKCDDCVLKCHGCLTGCCVLCVRV